MQQGVAITVNALFAWVFLMHNGRVAEKEPTDRRALSVTNHYHWFEWVDEPKEGRFDGEDSNYGLVDIQDRPYQEFVEAVRKANAAAREAHQKAVSQ
jgi:hypothetical protein